MPGDRRLWYAGSRSASMVSAVNIGEHGMEVEVVDLFSVVEMCIRLILDSTLTG
jgi:hypothetical protein